MWLKARFRRAVVIANVPDNAVVAGVPARVIKMHQEKWRFRLDKGVLIQPKVEKNAVCG